MPVVMQRLLLRLAAPHTMRVLRLLLHVSCMWHFAGTARGQDGGSIPRLHVVSTWQMKDGLPSDRTRSVLQSRSGYLWVSTAEGVARFDGVRFRNFDVGNTPSLENSYCELIFEDRAGRLWISHDSGEVTIVEDGQFRALPLRDGWLGSQVSRIVEDRFGTVWLLNRRGHLRQVRDERIGPILSRKHQPVILNLIADRDGRIWACTGSAVFELDERGEVDTQVTPELEGFENPMIWPARDGGIWIAQQAWFRRWHDGNWVGPARQTALDPTPPDRPTHWLEMSSGMMVVATIKRGLLILAPDGQRHEISVAGSQEPHRHPLGSPGRVTALHEDREGNLWVATGGNGLSLVRPRTVTMRPLPGNRRVLAAISSKQGGMWIGTEGAGLYRLNNQELRRYTDKEGLRNHLVSALAEDAEGRLWVANSASEILRFDGQTFQPVTTLPALRRIHALMPANGGVWVGGDQGGFLSSDGTFTPLSTTPEETPTNIRCFAQSPDGAVWIGTRSRGLFRYANGSVSRFTRDAEIPGNQIWALHADADGTVWAAIFGHGLARIRAGRIALISSRNGLPSDVICHLLDDGLGNLWLSSNRGISRISRADLDRCADGQIDHFPSLLLTTSDGLTTLELIGGEHSAGCRTNDGRLWFATTIGLATLSPDVIRSNNSSPLMLIEEIRAGDRKLAGISNANQTSARWPVVQVPPGVHGLEIDYAGLSFAAPNRVRFRYRFEGRDRKWTEVGEERTARFRDLPPGEYTFQVTASTGESAWAEPAALTLRIAPFFWQTTWFAILSCTGAVVLLGGIAYAIARREHRKRMIEIEHQRAIERDRTRIAHDLHDDIGAGLTQLNLLAHATQKILPDPARAEVRVQEMRTAITDMTESLDEIVWAINPRHDSLDSLVGYLGKFIQDFLHRGGVRCLLDFPIELNDIEVTSEVRHGLYLTMREALHNVLRHSGATEVRVSMKHDSGFITFQIDDNGRGFPPADLRPASDPGARRSNGVGLGSMKRRLAEIGGDCTIADRTEGGVSVVLRLPLRHGPRPSVAISDDKTSPSNHGKMAR